jgi:hypothetical protein
MNTPERKRSCSGSLHIVINGEGKLKRRVNNKVKVCNEMNLLFLSARYMYKGKESEVEGWLVYFWFARTTFNNET